MLEFEAADALADGIRIRGPQIVVALLFEMRAVIDEAKKLGVVGGDATIETLAREHIAATENAEHGGYWEIPAKTQPKRHTRFMLGWAAMYAWPLATHLEPTLPNLPDPVDDRWPRFAANATIYLTFARGMLRGLRETAETASWNAAQGRRKIGANKRESIRKAAEKYRGHMSRERAAFEIEKELGASASSIRRLLSELYPGASWKDPNLR
ncbi:MAG: hypothetical protein M0Z99_32360 [Betaproteobacteria bacterium]|nr:hypothetical protein [Betaproteobacteria bacterium]